MTKLHFGIDLETLANIVREVELHLNDGWAKGVPIVAGDGKVIVSGDPGQRPVAQSMIQPAR